MDQLSNSPDAEAYALLKSRVFSVAALCEELNCTRQSLANWERQQLLIPRYLGKRKFYLGADLVNTLLNSSNEIVPR